MVASATKVNNPSAFVLWANMFQNDAFGNFATLLNDVTLSPVMGNYLDMVNNDKPNPATDSRANENYARESMQLFTVGLNLLNQDGTPQVDGSGNPIPTYTQDTITAFARVFTGWTYPTKPGATGTFRQSRILRWSDDRDRQPPRHRRQDAAERSDRFRQVERRSPT